MDDQEKPQVKPIDEIVTPKSPGQLSEEERWGNLYSILVNQEFNTFSIPEQFKENPRSFMNQKKAYEKNLEDQGLTLRWHTPTDPEEIRLAEQYRNYNRYVSALRGLRRFQKDDISTYIEQHSDRPPKDSYLEAVHQYNAKIGLLALEELNTENNFWGDNPKTEYVIDPEIIANGAGTRDKFYETLDDLLKKRPDLIYDRATLLLFMLPTDQIRDRLFQAKGKYKYLSNFQQFDSFLSTEDKQELFKAAINMPNIYYQESKVLDYFLDTKNQGLFDPDETHTYIMDAMVDLNSYDVYTCIDTYLKSDLFTRDDLYTVLHRKIAEFKPLDQINLLFPLLESPEKAQKLKQSIVDEYAGHAQIANISSLMPIIDTLSEEDKYRVIHDILVRDKFSTSYNRDITWFEQTISTEKFRPILGELLADPDFPLDHEGISLIFSAKCLQYEEKKQFVNSLIANNKIELLLPRITQYIDLLDDDDQKEDITNIVINEFGLKSLVKQGGCAWARYLDTEAIKACISETEHDLRSFENWMYGMHYWGEKFTEEKDYVFDLVTRKMEANAPSIMANIDDVLPFIPEDQQAGFITSVVDKNPFAAIYNLHLNNDPDYFSKHGVQLSAVDIMDRARANTTTDIAPKVFKSIYQQYSDNKDVEHQKAIITEGGILYQMIGLIKSEGMLDEYMRLHSEKPLTEKEEYDLINTVFSFALLKNTDAGKYTYDNIGATIEESKKILFENLSEVLHLQDEITPEQADNFFSQMETPAPFLTYVLQLQDKEAHSSVLRGIFTSLLDRKFDDWKYGANTPEDFTALQQMQLVPTGLTYEQYQIWRKDEQSSLFESLETDTTTAANAIKTYLENNISHLEITDIIDELEDKYHQSDKMESLKTELAKTGQELGDVNKQLTAMRKLAETTGEDSSTIHSLTEKKTTLEKKRKQLVRAKKIFQLLTLKPEEVASGYIIEGKAKASKNEPLQNLLAELRTSSKLDNQFVYTTVQQMLDSFHAETGEQQNLVTRDSSDPKIWLEIGENPVSSCQSYNYGSYNECLLGYTEPNTKILILANERGKFVGRSIFKILTDKDGNPALHLETIYTGSTSPGVQKSIYTRAYQKAQSMGMKLYVSVSSQNEHGETRVTEAPSGYTLNKTTQTLHNIATRAPEIYLDSIGGKVKEGKYSIPEVSEVTLAA